MRAKWLHAIQREDFTPSVSSGVCIKHFNPLLVIREDVLTRDDGSILVSERKLLKLTRDAVPTILPGDPSFMTYGIKSIAPKMHASNQHLLVVSQIDQRQCQNMVLSDNIKSFSDFKCSFIVKFDLSSWTVFTNDHDIVFMKLSTEGGGKIIMSVKVKDDLSVEIWHEGILLDNSKFKCFLGERGLCDRWSKFKSLLGVLNTHDLEGPCITNKVGYYLTKLQEVIEPEASSGMVNVKRFNFALQQLSLSVSRKKSYHPEMLLWARTLYASSPSCYNLLRNSDVMSLPHPDYVRKTNPVDVQQSDPDVEQPEPVVEQPQPDVIKNEVLCLDGIMQTESDVQVEESSW